jgi:hypothetical protein
MALSGQKLTINHVVCHVPIFTSWARCRFTGMHCPHVRIVRARALPCYKRRDRLLCDNVICFAETVGAVHVMNAYHLVSCTQFKLNKSGYMFTALNVGDVKYTKSLYYKQ